MTKIVTVKIKLDDADDAILNRLCTEKGMSRPDGVAHIAKVGFGRKRATYTDRDKRAGNKVSKPAKAKAAKPAKAKAKAKAAKPAKKAAAKSTARVGKKAAKTTKKTTKKTGGLSAAQLDQVRDYKAAGFSNADIAKETGLSKDQVYRALKAK